jgi:hypothetical protein
MHAMLLEDIEFIQNHEESEKSDHSCGAKNCITF